MIERIEILLLVASVVAIISRRIAVPYTVGLVLAGFALGAGGLVPDISFTKEVIYSVLLPPLIFEATIHIRWSELRRDLTLILFLSTVGIAVGAAVSAGIIYYFTDLGLKSSLIVAVVLAATDPVSVLAIFQESGLKGREKLLVEAESLFNDGTTVLLFTLVMFYSNGHVGTDFLIIQPFLTICGGILCGLIIGYVSLFLSSRTDDHLVEITVSTIAAYAPFMIAEHFHASGILATLCAGLVVGNEKGRGLISKKGREGVISFWEYAGFVANSIIFLLIGMDFRHHPLSGNFTLIIWAIIASLIGRAATIYLGCSLFSKSKSAVPWLTQHLLFWGGLRGALALALVLGSSEITEKSAVTSAVFYVVLFSIIVQGLTVRPLINRVAAIR